MNAIELLSQLAQRGVDIWVIYTDKDNPETVTQDAGLLLVGLDGWNS